MFNSKFINIYFIFLGAGILSSVGFAEETKEKLVPVNCNIFQAGVDSAEDETVDDGIKVIITGEPISKSIPISKGRAISISYTKNYFEVFVTRSPTTAEISEAERDLGHSGKLAAISIGRNTVENGTFSNYTFSTNDLTVWCRK
jgi:hypothetical protein